jgi:hypothetical protein
MKNPAYEQIQARKVKARLRMQEHAQRISGNVSQTFRFFSVSRALYYIWKERYERHGVAGLRDLPRRPHRTHFVATALETGKAAIVLVSESQRHGLLQRLKARGLDVVAAIESGRLLPF